MNTLHLHKFICPYCGETISMQFELLYGGQSYIEDCEVCCQPILINYEVSQEYTLSTFTAEATS